MIVLVTGATGFIGGWTIAALTAAGHDVVGVLRDPVVLAELQTATTDRGGDGSKVCAIMGDLSKPGLGIGDIPDVDVVVHLGAVFGWGLDLATARRVNVVGTVEAVRLAAAAGARLILVGGFMLRNTAHLEELGLRGSDPGETDWDRLYARVGVYEGSKIEGFVRGRAQAQSRGLMWSAVHPATLSGHSVTGELPATQPFAELITAVRDGRMLAIPGGPDHWLPLVTVDYVADLLAAVAADPPLRGTEMLALDPTTPDFAELVGVIARAADRPVPTRRVSVELVRQLAGMPVLGRLVSASPESLAFIRTERYDQTVESDYTRPRGLEHPNLSSSIIRTVLHTTGPVREGRRVRRADQLATRGMRS